MNMDQALYASRALPQTGRLMLKDEDLRTALKDEYLLLQNQYEDFDRRSLTIKGWFGGGAAAAVHGLLAQPAVHEQAAVGEGVTGPVAGRPPSP